MQGYALVVAQSSEKIPCRVKKIYRGENGAQVMKECEHASRVVILLVEKFRENEQPLKNVH